MEEVLVLFFRFFVISGAAGSGKPGASQLDESLGQEELNDISSMPIGPANPPIHLFPYSYFNPILLKFKYVTIKNYNILLITVSDFVEILLWF